MANSHRSFKLSFIRLPACLKALMVFASRYSFSSASRPLPQNRQLRSVRERDLPSVPGKRSRIFVTKLGK
ncbi:hypothetical protein D3C75_985990 [compost metagenome]